MRRHTRSELVIPSGATFGNLVAYQTHKSSVVGGGAMGTQPSLPPSAGTTPKTGGEKTGRNLVRGAGGGREDKAVADLGCTTH